MTRSARLGQAGAPQLQALLHHVAAELLLSQVRVVPGKLLHDAFCRLRMPQLQHVLDNVVPKGILQAQNGSSAFSAL